MYEWRRLDREIEAMSDASTHPLTLRPQELARFETNTREHFLLSRVYDVQAMPDHATRSIEEIRRWIEKLLRVADRINIHEDTE